MATIQLTGTYELVTCANCGMNFAVPRDFATDRRRDHGTFYCPQKHSNYYPGESDIEKADRLRANAERRMGWAEARARAAQDQAEAAERSRAAIKGHLTRMRNKVANGVCPVPDCRRHFNNVAAHLQTEHEGWLADHDVLLRQAGWAPNWR